MYDTIIRKPDAILVTGAQDALVESEIKGNSVVFSVTSGDEPLLYVRARWNFETRLGGKVLADEWERGYGSMGFRSINPLVAMPWYFLRRDADRLYGYGVKVRPNALCFWNCDPQGITLWMDVRNGGEGVLLGGRKLEICTVVSETYDMGALSSFKAAREFCRVMCTDGIFADKPVYGSNNWYYAYGKSSREELLADTDYLMSMTKDLENPPFMVMDDGWQVGRKGGYIGGPWESAPHFGDMTSLMHEIKKKGARPGIWVRYLLDNRETIPQEWRLASGYLDPSNPDVLNYVREVTRTVCSWGTELIKHDYSTFDIFGRWGFQMSPTMTDAGWHFGDRTRTSAEIVKAFYSAILEGAKPTNTLILGCNTIGHLGAGLMQANRTGDDTSGREWERTLRMGVNTLAFRLMQTGIFYDIDADCVGIMQDKIPWKQNRMWAEVLAKSGSPLFVSAKPGVLTEDEKAELAEFYRYNSIQKEVAEPLDWEDKFYPEKWLLEGEVKEFPWDYENGLIDLQINGLRWNDSLHRELTAGTH